MIDNELEFDRLAEAGGKSYIKKRMMVCSFLFVFQTSVVDPRIFVPDPQACYKLPVFD
jgi:hypothetical protein